MGSIEIRVARHDERHRVRAFYDQWAYAGVVTDAALVFVAELDQALIGVLRLEPEHDTWVLRGMRVQPEHQRRGVGTALLQAVTTHLGDTPCYCVPYAHLVRLYGLAGFVEVALDRSPAFLRERVHEYRARGVDAILMRRTPVTNFVIRTCAGSAGDARP